MNVVYCVIILWETKYVGLRTVLMTKNIYKEGKSYVNLMLAHFLVTYFSVSYTHLTLPTIYSV